MVSVMVYLLLLSRFSIAPFRVVFLLMTSSILILIIRMLHVAIRMSLLYETMITLLCLLLLMVHREFVDRD